jgi:hypothetical protein
LNPAITPRSSTPRPSHLVLGSCLVLVGAAALAALAALGRAGPPDAGSPDAGSPDAGPPVSEAPVLEAPVLEAHGPGTLDLPPAGTVAAGEQLVPRLPEETTSGPAETTGASPPVAETPPIEGAARGVGGRERPLTPIPEEEGPRELKTRDLKSTSVLATTDGSWPQGTNAVWCATAEMVWREFGERLLGEPIQTSTECAMCAQLSAAPPISLAPAHRYGGAGPRTAAAIASADRGLHAQFPAAPSLPAYISPGGGYFAVAYLEAAFKFGAAFRDLPYPLWVFPDPSGSGVELPGVELPGVQVQGFGIPSGVRDAMKAQRAQVALLHARVTEDQGVEDLEEYVLDLDRGSKTFQLILAAVPRAPTLAATWGRVEKAMRAYAVAHPGAPAGMGKHDVLRVPKLNFGLTHIFKEVEGHALANQRLKGQFIERLLQKTTVRLDKSGVATKSLAVFVTRGGHASREYTFDQRFLLALRERGQQRPFLLIWVEDAELLTRTSR